MKICPTPQKCLLACLKMNRNKKERLARTDGHATHTPPSGRYSAVQSKYGKTHLSGVTSRTAPSTGMTEEPRVDPLFVPRTCSYPQTAFKEAFHVNSRLGAPHKAALEPFPFSKMLGSHLSFPRTCPFQGAPQSCSTPANPRQEPQAGPEGSILPHRLQVTAPANTPLRHPHTTEVRFSLPVFGGQPFRLVRLQQHVPLLRQSPHKLHLFFPSSSPRMCL